MTEERGEPAKSGLSQWLIRTSKNLLIGPYPKEKICQMVREGQLEPQDEVCEANRYWFYLHERSEVQRQLGIDLPKRKRGPDDETTETQTETQTQTEIEITDPGIAEPKTQEIEASSEPNPDTDAAASVAVTAAGAAEPPPTQSSQSQPQPSPRVIYRPMVLSDLEAKAPFWRILFWVLVALLLASIFVVLMILRR